MSDRREVNVERPEHSWIPFYRKLAEMSFFDVTSFSGIARGRDHNCDRT